MVDDLRDIQFTPFAHQMFGRTIRASIATDNGRSAEFIRKRTYENKQRCYECGAVDGDHLSYQCPANVLGIRQPPIKRKQRPRDSARGRPTTRNSGEDDDGSRAEHVGADDISSSATSATKKPKYKPSAYFSDDEDVASD